MTTEALAHQFKTQTERQTRKPKRDREADLRAITAALPAIELEIAPGRPLHAEFKRLCYFVSEYNARMLLAQKAVCGLGTVTELRNHKHWETERRRFVKHGVRALLVTEAGSEARHDVAVEDPLMPGRPIYLRCVYVHDVSQTVEREQDR